MIMVIFMTMRITRFASMPHETMTPRGLYQLLLDVARLPDRGHTPILTALSSLSRTVKSQMRKRCAIGLREF